MASKSGKGSRFERQMCAEFSLWWTGGERDDVFWRTSGSGGRATARGRDGKATRNHHGDMLATDPVGQPLLDLLALEFKRGYSGESLMDCLDRPAAAAEQAYERWIRRIAASAKASKVPYWLLVVRRDRRLPYAFIPEGLASRLRLHFGLLEGGIHFHMEVGDSRERTPVGVVGMSLGAWFSSVDPDGIRRGVRSLGDALEGG